MRRYLGVLVVSFMCCALSANAGLISWIYGADLGVSYTAGWSVRLYEDVNQDGFGGGFTIGADDVYSSIETFLASGKSGVNWGDSFNSPGGSLALSDHVYTVIFNDAVVASATQYIIVDAATFVLPGTDVDSSYIPASVNGSWQAVPEPSTMALLGIGLATTAFVRKRKKRRARA